jgi:uncharacterized protein (TIGR03437 family)
LSIDFQEEICNPMQVIPIALRRAATWTALIVSSLSAHAAEPDAVAISANIEARHLPFGTILDPVFASPDSDQIVGYTRCGDSALWTGHYLAAESFRYKVTQSPDALNNVKQAIAGIKSLADVTGTNLLARCIVSADSPFAAGIQSEEAKNGIHMASPWIWVGNTSRDEYSGVIFGLAVAYDMVDDAAIKTSISDLVTRLIRFLTGNNWSVVMPDGSTSTTFLVRPDQMLAFLQVGRHINSGQFSTAYDEQRILLGDTGVMLAPLGVDATSNDSYFKFNLDFINLYNLTRLESNSTRAIYEKGYSIVRNHTAGDRNVFFDVIDRALEGPNAARDTETLALLDQWLLRPKRDQIVDLHTSVAVCGSEACQPVPVPLRPPTDFIWQRDPFQLSGGSNGTIETAGIDYILPYWMGRYYGVGAAFTVQSAAATSPAIAPNSLASIFGSNLAAQTGQANSLPLPTSLGGIGITVKDATGTERSAPLIYVSPGQVNLIIPDGTASGTGTFTINGGTAAITATGNVESVVPTLFSMNGNGMGVAAAVAIRTNNGNPQVQSPVPVFQCDSSGCVSTPIDLGVDTPVYLSLYGTGIRNRSSLSNVSVTINNIGVPVLYGGPQTQFDGLDQVNVLLSLNLRGSGESNVVLKVDGQTANTVTVNLK